MFHKIVLKSYFFVLTLTLILSAQVEAQFTLPGNPQVWLNSRMRHCVAKEHFCGSLKKTVRNVGRSGQSYTLSQKSMKDSQSCLSL